MFGISLTEIAIIAMVALVVVGPHKLPGMLRRVGGWIGKLRRLTTEVRQQTGIDDILREEGIDGGLNELRSMMRGDIRSWSKVAQGGGSQPGNDPYAAPIQLDRTREYPVEGPDAHDALPDDLVDDEDEDALDPEEDSAFEPAEAKTTSTDA